MAQVPKLLSRRLNVFLYYYFFFLFIQNLAERRFCPKMRERGGCGRNPCFWNFVTEIPSHPPSLPPSAAAAHFLMNWPSLQQQQQQWELVVAAAPCRKKTPHWWDDWNWHHCPCTPPSRHPNLKEVQLTIRSQKVERRKNSLGSFYFLPPPLQVLFAIPDFFLLFYGKTLVVCGLPASSFLVH